MSQLFSALASSNTEPDLLKNLDAVKTPRHTDTHPPLSLSLKALNTSVELIAQEAVRVSYDEKCISLFEGLGQLETQISGIEWELEIA